MSLGACGSGNDDAAVRQVASVIAEQRPAVRKAIREMDPCIDLSDSCDRSDIRFPARLSIAASGLASELDNVEDHHGGYPGEVERLAGRTHKAATAVAEEARRFMKQCPDLSGCWRDMNDLGLEIGGLASVLSAWDPYI